MPISEEDRERATKYVQEQLTRCCQGDTSYAIASEILGYLYDVERIRINPSFTFDKVTQDIQKIVKEPKDRNYGADHFLERNAERLSREIATLLVNDYGLECIPT
jgi:hypothetical protein